ncbi:MAG: tRNA epoxyqueuosine(34) reductase QueG [Candidatus Thiodiazotropha lotti]|uniref:Epoxyqueuosine reductase n=1 Tax=Candidatus Thiodiazotropha lotti TaxID=2792787 RepID=A0A9E4K2U5_9GAMM|nr:tRNA epoxyqueuosine(34) reductase QueG [Candidatus Thiodiazotropha lotti]ODB99396.1 tRNA epoxyqueuosine(34) reductase QueG [Candidatus Thiodiazotropha endoloripes]MCG7938601.1 tRNA epoxyqueuosine(34) reductase QueG [Candidatus Thiodiazotropha lotti]MCG7987955.1 tRNA epoxyqueuosine(34) reductase QueG [Candidatus Thiodiazotropha lotti]MCG8020142.1 tRNA epoxyqueuosine(34) reductase QueG [Candidatus Thiodiazotropha lotti]
MSETLNADELLKLSLQIKQWGEELGFDAVGITDTDLSEAERRLQQWLTSDCHGEMDYMARHGSKRSRPVELEPGTVRVISVRMDYLPEPMQDLQQVLDDPQKAFISRYALGRDYHKLLRNRLKKLQQKIQQSIPDSSNRLYVDSAPVLEKPLAEKAGLGWIGKHTNLLNKRSGSWFFLGEIYTSIPLPIDRPAENHCGRCQACLEICPTRAITAPYQLDARRCISYLTIELNGAIPEPFRAAMGNRIYGCDDCQQICPWNRFAQVTDEQDFLARHHLDSSGLLSLFDWDETTFLQKTEGSAIRRIGYQRWQRNLAVALGNTPPSDAVEEALLGRLEQATPLVKEHILWALSRQRNQPATL